MKVSGFLLAVPVVLILAGCAPTKNLSATDAAKNKNNVVKSTELQTTNSEATATQTETSRQETTFSGNGTGGGAEISFEGSNNLLEMISENAGYFDASHKVIIVKGNNNIIRLYHVSLVDMNAPGADTLILVGNQQKYVMDLNNSVPLKKQPSKTETINMETSPIPASTFSSDFSKTERMQNMLANYQEGLAAGDPETYLRLAKIYHFGLDEDLEPSLPKAIDLYEFAAVKNNLEAIRALGEIFANEQPDKLKAIYFFTLGDNLDDDYSKDRLQDLRNTK